MTTRQKKWKHSKTINDGELFTIKGLNIWDNQWLNTREKIHIKDPIYAQDFTFNVYEITNGKTTARFSAGEFSNCVWGIYEEAN